MNFGNQFILGLLVFAASDEIFGNILLLFLHKQTVWVLAEEAVELPWGALLGCSGAVIVGQACRAIPRASRALVV